MPLSLNNNRGSVYSERMKIEVPERWCLTVSVRRRGNVHMISPDFANNLSTESNQVAEELGVRNAHSVSMERVLCLRYMRTSRTNTVSFLGPSLRSPCTAKWCDTLRGRW